MNCSTNYISTATGYQYEMHNKTSLKQYYFYTWKSFVTMEKKHNVNISRSLVSSEPLICSQVNKPSHMTHVQFVLFGNQMIHTCNRYLNYDMNNSLWCDEVSKFHYLPVDKTWHHFNNAWQMKCRHSCHRRVVHKSKRSGGITEFVHIQASTSTDHTCSLNRLYPHCWRIFIFTCTST